MSTSIKLPLALQDRLRCPICGARLVLAGEQMVCTHADSPHSFPVMDGVPVLINETRSVFTIADFACRQATYFDLSPAGRAVAAVDHLLPSFHRDGKKKQNLARFARLLTRQSTSPKILVIGGSILGPGMKEVMRLFPTLQVVHSDVSFGPQTMVIADAHDIPFDDGSFDGIIVQAVLQAVADPWRCVEEIHRVLTEDGLVYAETPFMQQVHGGRYDFTRFTHLGHRRLFRRFEEIESGTGQGPGTALAWSCQYFLLGFATSKPVRGLIHAFSRLALFYLKYFDLYLGRKPGAFDASSGYFFLGRKSDQTLADRDLLQLYRGGLR